MPLHHLHKCIHHAHAHQRTRTPAHTAFSAHTRTPATRAHQRTRAHAHTRSKHLCHAAPQHQSPRVNPMPLKRARTAYKAFSPLALCHPCKKILMSFCAFSRVNPNRAGMAFAYAPSLRQCVRLRAYAYMRTPTRTQARKTLCFTRVY
jgi:hypothetical protein